MTNHDKLSQKIQNTAQIFWPQEKEAKLLPPDTFPGLKTIESAARAQTSPEGLQCSPRPAS